MMAFGFCQDYFRLVGITTSRLGYKFSEIMNMQLGESVVFIPMRDRFIDPIRNAYLHTLENPTKDILGQAVDLYSDNVRILGVAYIVAENKLRLIFSRVSNELIDKGHIPNLDVIRFLDFELSEYEHFTHTFMNINRWNIASVRQITDIDSSEFGEMFKCSASTLNGSVQCFIDLNKFKEASVTKDRDLKICTGHLIEEQRFYDLDMDGSLKHYATVSTGYQDEDIPDLILNEFLTGVTVSEPGEIIRHKLVLEV